MNNFNKKIRPFVWFCMNNFPFIEETLDEINEWNLLCKVVGKLNEVIAKCNETGQQVQELTELFNQLQDYVEHYFDNLDIQEEVNNKLDEMVKDGTLQEIVETYLGSKVEYIFPKFWPDALSGDLNLIKYKNINILVDTHQERYYSKVKQFLSENNVTHIDYFILSHYDSDHVGNFKNLVNDGYIDTETKLYMPGETIAFTNVVPTITDIKNFCNRFDLQYYVPFENEILEIDDIKITFYNTNVTIMDQLYYYDVTGYKDYNNESLVFLLEHKNIKSFYGGDGATLCLKRLSDDNFIKGQVNLMKVEHHGINQGTYNKFYYETKPVYAVQQSYIDDSIKNNYGICQATSIMRRLGTTIYPCFMQPLNIKFTSFENNLTCDVGKPYNISKQLENITYYVDINASVNSIQDGTQEHPYKELMQVLPLIENSACIRATINLADGHYAISHETSEPAKNKVFGFTGLDTQILIQGNSSDRTAVVIESCDFYNSNIILKDLTVNAENGEGIYLRNSKCKLNNVLVTSIDENISTHSALILRENSKVIIDNNTLFDYINQCIVATDSEIVINDLTVGENIGGTPFALSTDTNIVNIHTLNFSDADMKKANRINYGINNKPQSIYVDGTGSDDINLIESMANVKWAQITAKSNDNVFVNSGKIYYPYGKIISLISSHVGNDGNIYNKQCQVQISANEIKVIKQKQIKIDTNNVVTVDSGDYFKIIRVEIGYDEPILNNWLETTP